VHHKSANRRRIPLGRSVFVNVEGVFMPFIGQLESQIGRQAALN
jgi:hypothetical protein